MKNFNFLINFHFQLPEAGSNCVQWLFQLSKLVFLISVYDTFTCSPLGVNCNLIALVLLCFILNVDFQSYCSSVLIVHFPMFIFNLIALVFLRINLSSSYQYYSWQANACHEYVASCLTFYCIEVSRLYIYNIGPYNYVWSFNLGLELSIVSIYCV